MLLDVVHSHSQQHPAACIHVCPSDTLPANVAECVAQILLSLFGMLSCMLLAAML